ncbi:hypothetical protein [Mesorhizobium sp. A623]
MSMSGSIGAAPAYASVIGKPALPGVVRRVERIVVVGNERSFVCLKIGDRHRSHKTAKIEHGVHNSVPTLVPRPLQAAARLATCEA